VLMIRLIMLKPTKIIVEFVSLIAPPL